MAASYDINFTQGDNFAMRLGPVTATEGVPFNFDGYSVRMQVRKALKSPVLVELSTENGKISIEDGLDKDGNPAKFIRVRFAPEDSRPIPADLDCGYDCEITNNVNYTRTILAGLINVTGDFTRE